MVLKKIFKSYHFGLNYDLQEKDLSTLIDLFGHKTTSAEGVLGGRGAVSKVTLSQAGPVIIKTYKRGGMIRHIIRSHYLKLGKTRPELEYDMLNKVAMLNIPVPAPVAWAHKRKGGLFYKGWLVTKEITNQNALSEICTNNRESTSKAIKKAVSHIITLIQNNIYHVDLHPGNVLVDTDNNVFLIDFDKSRVSRLNNNQLTLRYINRWNRAVLKYNLPEYVSALFSEEFLRLGFIQKHPQSH